MSQDTHFCIAIPSYRGGAWIRQTLESILAQSYQEFHILIVDDNSRDDTLDIAKAAAGSRVRIERNEHNVGYGKNLQRIRALAEGDALYLMGQDDLLLPGALQRTNELLKDPRVGCVTRPYYWFDTDPRQPVRSIEAYDPGHDRIISITDGADIVRSVFDSVGQLSGLAYRISCMDSLRVDFHEDVFPSHVYPFAAISRAHKIGFLGEYAVAVRIESSQTRFKPAIYEKSPTRTWIALFDTVYGDAQFAQVRDTGKKMFATNFVGLVQLKNYSTYALLMREIGVHVAVRPANLLHPGFWAYALLTLLVPRGILRKLTDWYKRKVLAKTLARRMQ